MKKILTFIFSAALLFSGASLASAQMYSYGNQNNTYSNYSYCGTYGNYGCGSSQQYQVASYYYTSDCYTYYYDGYKRSSSIVSYNCQQTNTNYNYQYTYTYPQQYQSNYVSPYYTYKYSNGSWYPSYINTNNNGYTDTYYNNNSYYNNSYNQGNYSNNCYWQGGYQMCY